MNRRIALAESCTGGLVAAALTEIPGSSDVLEASIVTYSNEAKAALLRVSTDVLETFGAVSVAVAWSMARGALEKTGADTAVAITGIAGPDGGTETKPVGTVFIAIHTPDRAVCRRARFVGDRAVVRLQSVSAALDMLRLALTGHDPIGTPR